MQPGTGDAAAAAAEQRRQQEEEEEMTPYSQQDLSQDWEFKIVRSVTGGFKKARIPAASAWRRKARAGWVLVEKFDNSRVRLKRQCGRPRAGREAGRPRSLSHVRRRIAQCSGPGYRRDHARRHDRDSAGHRPGGQLQVAAAFLAPGPGLLATGSLAFTSRHTTRMHQEHDRAGDEQAVGDVEVGPRIEHLQLDLGPDEQNPIPHAVVEL